MTPPQPARVLVLRTSRFVGTAIDIARAAWPDAAIRVVHQAGSEPELERAGIGAGDRIVAPAGARLSPISAVTSGWGWQARLWQPDHVVLQWWNERGEGHAAANAAALWFQPRGFHAVVVDGACRWQPAPVMAKQIGLKMACRAFAVAALIAIPIAATLLWPTGAWRRRSERRRMSAAA